MKKPQDIKILIADDETELCDLLAEEVEDSGYTVLRAHSGKEAIAILQKESVDLIISDMNMPDGTGVDLLDHVQETSSHRIPFLFVTGQSKLSIAEAFYKGAEAVFDKPLDIDVLISSIQKLTQSLPQGKLKRRASRTDASIELMFQLTPEQAVRKTKTLNIGRGGFFLLIDHELPPIGQTMTFEISSGGRRVPPIQGECVVRWQRSSNDESSIQGVGVELQPMPRSTEEHFFEFLNLIRTEELGSKT